ncbi:SAP domain-containing protein [Staphylococcus aureus]|nr:DNA-binding protein [Staphylococcus aureus]GBX67418.1 SAP domain-containing protein [Staphylococcus aureus]
MTTTGTKPELVKRIDDNYLIFNNLALSYVYIPTKKGEEILKETKYLTLFVNNPYICVGRAYYIAENYIVTNFDDKFAGI